MRPCLKPALRRLVRDERTLQFGLHPLRAVVLGDVDAPMRRLIEALDGTWDLPQLLEYARSLGMTASDAQRLLDFLIDQELIEDVAADTGVLRTLTRRERDRLCPDLRAVSLFPGVRDGGLAVLDQRRSSFVHVYGAGRVGTQIAALLGASGVGRICVVDPGLATAADVVPGGLTWKDIGESRDEGAAAAVRRLMPSANAWTGAGHLADGSRLPDLAVLSPTGALDPVLVRDLMHSGVPHLLATGAEGIGSVGPLVIPGRSACLWCLDLTRRDRDPLWPRVAVQADNLGHGEDACDAVLAAATAAQSVAQVLGYLSQVGESAVINGTLELVSPDWRWRRRSWTIYPHCRCSRNNPRSLTIGA